MFQAFPVAYILMADKTEALHTCTVALRRMMEIFEELHPNLVVQPTLMISDYEQAILSATQTVFPTGRARGCWFHFAQVIYF